MSAKKQSQNWGSVRMFFMTKIFSDLLIEISFRHIPESFIEDKSAFVQVIAFCCEATTIN